MTLHTLMLCIDGNWTADAVKPTICLLFMENIPLRVWSTPTIYCGNQQIVHCRTTEICSQPQC